MKTPQSVLPYCASQGNLKLFPYFFHKVLWKLWSIHTKILSWSSSHPHILKPFSNQIRKSSSNNAQIILKSSSNHPQIILKSSSNHPQINYKFLLKLFWNYPPRIFSPHVLSNHIQIIPIIQVCTVRHWDEFFGGNGKTRVAQNSCNLSYLIRQRQEHQKNMQLKVFTT